MNRRRSLGSAGDGDGTEEAADGGSRRFRRVEVGPHDADAAPAGQAADELLTLLLTKDDVGHRLALPQQLLVLDLAVELQEHAQLRPGEVDAGDQLSGVRVPDLVLRYRPRQSLPPAQIERPVFAHRLTAAVHDHE